MSCYRHSDTPEVLHSAPSTLGVSGFNYNLDIFWLKDDSLEDTENLPEPEDLAAEALTHLEAAMDELQEILRFLGNEVK
jgi:hypothetical protein